MKTTKILPILLIIILSAHSLYSQNVKIDSLVNLLDQHPNEDTVRVNLLRVLTFEVMYNDPEKGIKYAEEALEIAKKLDYKRGIANAIHDMGNVHNNGGSYNTALSYYQKSLKIREEISDKKGIASSTHNIGLVYKRQGNYSLAIEYYQKSLKIREEIGDKVGIAASFNNIGVLYGHQGNYLNALDYHQKSLKIKEELGEKRRIARSINSIGVIHYEQGNYPLALEYHQKGLKLNEEIGDKAGIAASFNNIGNIFISQGNYPLSLEYFQKGLKLNAETGNKRGIAGSLNDMGKVYARLSNYTLALDCYQKSLEIAKGINYKLCLILVEKGMGITYFNLHDYNKALSHLLKSQIIAEELETIDELKEIHMRLAEVYEATKNYKLAYKSHVLYKQLNDSIFSEENIKKITGLEFQYEFDKEKQAIQLEQEKKDALLAAEAKRQSVIRNSFIAGFAGMAILVLLVWRNLHIRRKANSVLQLQKEELANALQQLKESQSQLIQSEKMASLGQLIAGIAHEVNTPLGAIKASNESIVYSMQESLEKQHELFNLLPEDKLEDYISLVNKCKENPAHYSSKEIRSFRKFITTQLEEQGIEDADSMADTLVDMDITDDITPFIPLLKDKHVDLILDSGYNLSSQFKSSLVIGTAVDKASKVVFALKNYSRSGEKANKETADITTGIETVLTLYDNRLKEGVELIKNYEDIPEILCYPDELNQVWTNLINNAAYAMDYKGTLEISVKKEDKNVIVGIKDSGKGIPEEIAEKIFNPFFTTKPVGEGTGLGLDIVKKIIKKHEGTIELECSPGSGTEFTITLPV